MCRKIEVLASKYNREETKLCFWSNEGNRVWIDAKDLDWLCDEVRSKTAKKLRELMNYDKDFEGPYYYFDF